MTRYIVKSTSTGIDLVGLKDLYLIGRNAVVSVSDDHAFFGDAAFYGNRFRIRGTVEATGAANDAFLIEGAHVRIAVSGTGKITSEHSAIELTASHCDVENNGVIAGVTYGVKLDAMVGLLKNSGTITSEYMGVYFAGRGGEVENYGVIEADRGIRQVAAAGEITSTFNSGIVNATVFSFAGSASNDTLSNRGEMDGSIRLYGGNDVFNNIGGTVKGNIVGGAGNDKFDIEDGTVTGVISGGLGNDLYMLDNTDLRAVEHRNGGTDRVVSSATYTLGSNLERLRLSGTDAIDGTGNRGANGITGNVAKNVLSGEGGNDVLQGLGGNDILDGGAGNDRLYGGAGADRFVFATRDHHDRIADFQVGVDKIDLSDLSAVTSFSDLTHHHIRTSGHNLVIFAGRDTLLLLHTATSDLHSSDFLF
jgi:Ca2+-binding RTX toxin-like protein